MAGVSTQDQLTDVNDKLSDMGFEPVTLEKVAIAVTKLSSDGTVMNLIHKMLSEIEAVSTLSLPSSGGALVEALEGVGLAAIFGTSPSLLQILDFLSSELQAQRLTRSNMSGRNQQAGGASAAVSPESNSNYSIKSTTTAVVIKSTIDKIANSLSISTNTCTQAKNGHIVPFLLSAHKQIRTLKKNSGNCNMLFNRTALDSQRDVLQKINAALRADYHLRRQMLLQRADITIQSFLWSKNVDRQKLEEAKAKSQKMRAALVAEPIEVSVDSVLDQHQTLLRAAQARITNDANMDHSVSHIIIAKVPDRGGRADDMRPSSRDYGFGGRRNSGGRGTNKNRFKKGKGHNQRAADKSKNNNKSNKNNNKQGRKAKGKVQGAWSGKK